MKALYRTRCHVVREDVPELELPGDRNVRGPGDVTALLVQLIGDQPNEVFVVLHLNAKNRVVGYAEAHRGVLDASLVHPREVFRDAIACNAASIIVAHNHPSGDPSPSPEDRQVTRQLVKAGELLGIKVLDSLVVTHSRTRSIIDS